MFGQRGGRMLRSLGVLGTVGVLLLSGVSPAAAGRAPAVHYGGTLNVRDDTNPDCLDPQRTALSASYSVFDEVLDTLVSENEKGKFVPDLALKWKASKGGTVITFDLRHGVRFSNGDPFTASDVKWTFDRAVAPATKSPASGGDLAAMKQVNVLNKYTVQIVLKVPNRPFLTNLAVSYLGILDRKALAKEGAAKFCQYPVGTGPFMITNAGPGFSSITLAPNRYHTWEQPWAHNQGKPYLGKLVWKSIVSDATAVSELLTGGIDVADFPSSQLPRVQKNKSIVLHKVPQQGEDYLGFNTAHAPFNNPDVRRAISEAIDRDAVIKAAFNGLAKPAYSPIPPTLQFYDKNAKNYAAQYNPADAQKVLAANHVTGPYTLLTFNDSTSTSVAELIQAELQQVGVKVTVVEKSVADYIPVASKGDFDMNYLGWGWPDPDFMYQLFHSSQESGGGLNFTNWKNAQSDALIIEGRQSLNLKKAAAAYAAWQRLMDTNAVIDPLVVPEIIYGTRSNVKGWHLNKAGELLFQDMYLGT